MSLKENRCLLLPGPVFIPHRVLQGMNKQMTNRRGAEFQALLEDVTERLKDVFKTKSDVLLFPASGTGGLELSIVNTLSPGDKVLSLTCGVFSERFAEIAENMDMQVQRLEFPYNEGVNVEKVQEALDMDKNKEIKAVLVAHNDTCTGTTADIKTLGRIVAEHGALLLVDAVSSLGAIDLRPEEWNLDIVVSASQKGLFSAPGVAMISVSEKAWEAIDRSTSPKYFWSLRRVKKSYDDSRLTPYTAAITTMHGLQEALKIIEEEGFENVLKRHDTLKKAVREGARALGLELFVGEENASNTVTTLVVPQGVGNAELRKTMNQKYHTLMAGGLGSIKDSVLRIGHLGYIGRGDILTGISALELALSDHGVDIDLGKGVVAAQKVFAEER